MADRYQLISKNKIGNWGRKKAGLPVLEKMASRKRTYTAAKALAVFLESEEDELSDLEEFADTDDDGVLGTDDEGSSEDENSGDSDQTEEYGRTTTDRASYFATKRPFSGPPMLSKGKCEWFDFGLVYFS